MHSEVSEISPVMVEVKVQVPWDVVRKDLDTTYGQLAKTAKVRGFRPGKVPRHVVKQLYGKQVKAEVTGTIVEKGLLHAVEEHELAVVAQPEVSPPLIEDGKDFEFTAKIEVRPKLDAVSVDGLEVTVAPVKVLDEAVDAEIDRLRKQHADLREPDPMRPAKDGDRLTIDYTVEIDGEAKGEMAAEGREVDLGDEDLLDAFGEGLVGAQPGEEKDIDVGFPEDHHHPDLKGKTATFHVKVKGLKELLLPELDDELAKDVGEFETLEELKTDIRDRLKGMAEQRYAAELKDAILDALLELNDVPVPPSMVQQQKQQMLYEMMTFAQMTGRQVSPDDLEGMDEKAERRVKAGILLDAIARLEEISIDEEALEAKLQEMAEETGKHIAKLRVEYSGERRDQLENQLLEEKIFGFLREKAKITEAEPKASSKEEGSATDEDDAKGGDDA